MALQWHFPDPDDYRDRVPGRLGHQWEFGGFTSREEFWAFLERLWGREQVDALWAGRGVELDRSERYFGDGA